ncbi:MULTISPECIES: hypothetical protein [unclassified Rhodococcus (in: high G+C Gram-positive bacteria)]|uniref:hypothetical protein n=1 Tax=unclassified Rhodococcus (in: high G+C Gram-positive bacteria) TaxID=192944 RepID=UPI001FF8004F|nr:MULTISPECIES: hypothetical protein [unclassified Rhodococcus (in: high G+C Gram-positive bacteria)]
MTPRPRRARRGGAVQSVGGRTSGFVVHADDPTQRLVLPECEQQVIGADPPVPAAHRLVPYVFDCTPEGLGEPFEHGPLTFRVVRAPIGG